jgi:DNA-binding response OmpR family regulator
MSFPKNILVVEHENGTKKFLTDIFLQHEVTQVDFCIETESVLDNLKKKSYDLILIDMDSDTEVDGVDLAKMIMEVSFFPIVFLGATNDRAQLQRVVDLAPFGFLFKPFSSIDISISLQLAYHNYLRQQKRCRKNNESGKSSIRRINERYVYDLDNKQLYQDGIHVRLNSRQLRTVDYLCQHFDTVVSYESLSYVIWDDYHKEGSKLRTLIYTIRKALPDFPLVSHSKVGYAIQSDLNRSDI